MNESLNISKLWACFSIVKKSACKKISYTYRSFGFLDLVLVGTWEPASPHDVSNLSKHVWSTLKIFFSGGRNFLSEKEDKTAGGAASYECQIWLKGCTLAVRYWRDGGVNFLCQNVSRLNPVGHFHWINIFLDDFYILQLGQPQNYWCLF